MIISLDTETTGIDLHHGVKPFIVTSCNQDGKIRYWQWEVDPRTRQPIIPQNELDNIRKMIDSAERIVGQNIKFDVHALRTIIPDLEWDWNKVDDTLVAAHLLASNEQKDLTALAAMYINEYIDDYEKRVEIAVQECHKLARRYQPTWRIAHRNLEEMPSAKNKVWKFDMWLPRVVAAKNQYPKNHSYWTVTSDYANKDSEVTLPIWYVQRDIIQKRGLWTIYEERMKALAIAYDMERRGVVVDKDKTIEITQWYRRESSELGRELKLISADYGHNLELPKKGVNNSIRTFMLDVLQLEPVYNEKSDTDAPTLDKDAMRHYLVTLPVGGTERRFVETLAAKARYDNSLSYLAQYRKYWHDTSDPRYKLLNPNMNMTATATLRWGGSNPNPQNVSKDEQECPKCHGEGCRKCNHTGMSLVSLRTAFCFGPDREGWSFDARNIELRIPFYQAKETELTALFERPNEPPYYGSNHLLNFHTVYPEIWEKELPYLLENKEHIKKKYKASYYQWCKNGGFAIQYNAGVKTADRAFHRDGAHVKLKSRFRKLEALNQYYIRQAERNGFVETLPDRLVCPERGYPILCARKWGSIEPTKPLNYHVQSTAMWWTMRAMIKVEEILREWRKEGFDAYIMLQVHDELVINFPKRVNPKDNPAKSNLGRARIIQREMASCGDDLIPSIPTPVSVGYHESNWSSELSF